jgi:hypothetical protein
MSYSINPEIDSTLSAIPHLDVNGNRIFYKRESATSYDVNGSNITFTVIPPSKSAFMNRCIPIITRIQLVYSGTTTGTHLLDDGFDSLRNLAGLRGTLSQNNTLNGSGFPQSVVNILYPDIIAHYNAEYKHVHPLGATDESQNLSDCVGSVNNPLASYSASEWDRLKRGAYIPVSITRTSTVCVQVFDLIEFVYVPGLLGLDQSEKPGIPLISTFTSQMRMDLDKKNIVSHASGGNSTITDCVITIVGQPYMILKFTEPPMELIPTEPIKYSYQRFEYWQQAYGGSVAANGVGSITSNNVQLQAVPRYLWLWVRESDAYKTFASSDTFAAITNVSVNFNSQAALLSTCNQHDLWQISRDCGCLDDWVRFQGKAVSNLAVIGSVGSLFCAEFGRHISLGTDMMSIGTRGNFNFQATINFTNTNQTTAMSAPTLFMVVGYDNEMVIEPTGTVHFVFPEIPVVGAGGAMSSLVKVPYGVDGYSGGSIKSFFQRANDWFKKTKLLSTIGKQLAPLVSSIPKVGPALQPLAQEALNQLEQKGYGGAQINKKQLQSLLRKL